MTSPAAPPPSAPPPPAFGPADLQLLQAIRTHDATLRAALCTVARYGVALRQAAPERARTWLDELAPHPYYKGGQFLFDLLEWEDFMTDGEPPAVLALPALWDVALLRAVLDRAADALRAVQVGLDGGAPLQAASLGSIGTPGVLPQLPPLVPGFYLYPDVVLGLVALVTASAG